MFGNNSILSLLALALFGLTSAEGVSSSTSSARVPVHTVSVAAEAHRFTPEVLTANVGEIIEFRFYPLNHSVARADFQQPCIPYELTGPGRQGFWSEFHPMNVIPSDPPSFRITVNDTKPIFYYCSAPGACDHDGMVGVINPNSTQTLKLQREAAEKASYAFSPGENFPEEVAASRSSSISAGLATSTSPPATSSSAAGAASHGSHSALSPGAIAGIVIGAVAVCLLAGALIYLCGRQKTIAEVIQTQHVQEKGQIGSEFGNNHNSMASSAAYPIKGSRYDVRSLDADRFSGLPRGGSHHGHSTAETESYRSRSPPMDEHNEFIHPMTLYHNRQNQEMRSSAFASSPPLGVGNMEMDGGDVVGHQHGPTFVVSPRSEQEGYQYMDSGADFPNGLRVAKKTNQFGPHELPASGN